MITSLSILAFILAAGPCLLFLLNLFFFPRRTRTTQPGPATPPKISVLIPARNEARVIGAAVESALKSKGVALEVLVMNDHSEDSTAEQVDALAAKDARVRLLNAPALPDDFCGKQFACDQLSRAARHPRLVFMDADVRLSPDALARMSAFMESRGVDLVSGIPRQITGTFLEKLLLPLIHFVLLGFLPFPAMRQSRQPKFAAGCGQLMMVRRDAYFKSGGHATIRQSLHDGLKLPKAFRARGYQTDLMDLTDLAQCRMYQDARSTWEGLAKNATEGLAAPGLRIPMTLILGGGQTLPFLLLPWLSASTSGNTLMILSAVTCAWLPRWIGVWRFHQSWLGALLHPLGIASLLLIQWQAVFRQHRGSPQQWKGRDYGPSAALSAPPSTVFKKNLSKAGTLLILLAVTAIGILSIPLSAQEETQPGSSDHNPCAAIHLKDQFGAAHQVGFPTNQLTLLFLADLKGSREIKEWLEPTRDRYRGKIRLTGVADVSAAPGPLRGWIKRKFRKNHPYPVMLDWTGDVTKRFQVQKDHINLYVITPEGRIILTLHGPASSVNRKKLEDALDPLLGEKEPG